MAIRTKTLMSQLAIPALLVLAVSGWGLFVAASGMLAGLERDVSIERSQLRSEREQVQEQRGQMTAQMTRLETEVGDLKQVQSQLASMRQELQRLEATRSELLAQLDTMQSERSAALQSSLAGAAPAQASDAPASLSRDDVDDVQRVLTQLGFGPLTPDGVMGSRTKRAIEAFERAKGLPVTGALSPQTLQALSDVGRSDEASEPRKESGRGQSG